MAGYAIAESIKDSPQPIEGHGGEFSGAGASGGWSSDPEPSSSSYDSSSSSYDSGSSSFDSGSSCGGGFDN